MLTPLALNTLSDHERQLCRRALNGDPAARAFVNSLTGEKALVALFFIEALERVRNSAQEASQSEVSEVQNG